MSMRKDFSTYTDEELFLLVKQGHKDAFEDVYRRFWQELLDAAYRRVKVQETAMELVQSLLVDLYLKRETISLTTSLRNYLHTSLKNRVLNTVRSQLVRNTYQQHVLNDNGLYQPDAATTLQLKELQRHIDESCASMPEKCREVFYLSRREHLSYQHIASQLNISVNTVEKHMVKALKILRSHLKQYHYILFWCLVALLLLCAPLSNYFEA
ncbi:RNA polymerase sigma-70 factor, ECF subfamily [Chitinophaga arvensicola]|uniref:RNA polymerase sigma-70 factor, ECF subfamily n=2 Tax=Chitinophaga arvensicola TaxID=29529 RepID=A0A1I0SB95_9BACT|nr:RNA polymerase sigma-70 factor, ECF subfamily [Chitinophaga arvensicola]